MIRATTSGVLNSYRTNLMQSFITQSTAMKNMLKPRNFHSYADDTASASRAYQIRRSLQRTGAQLGSSQIRERLGRLRACGKRYRQRSERFRVG